MADEIAGKIAIVTGGSRNIGRAIADRFLAEGATVIITCRTRSEGEAATADMVKNGGKAFYIRQDITSGEDWQHLTEQVMRDHGRIDILVCCAGYSTSESVLEGSLKTLRTTLDTNLRSCFLALKYVSPPMRQAGKGSIVFITSTSSKVGYENYSAYCASKGGERVLAKSAALELAKDGVRVNSLGPGICKTTMSAEIDPALDERIPIKRRAEASEIAGGVLFLASDRSSFVTGAELFIDGGMVAI
ncbi:SDR family NAD(P)-dependent oxidoreductase [Noviherbaspirillum sedimenti]|uniref:SDR family oxidoreductase n=1 Tax=Noviherbaspirillum sedimenti TaxID=2320865 RepID=A0A3A3GGE0_9BURK|nr:SDR family NAD(P)-dependent oxidoreductase [Noviherbaspirillum sedimenti]RJG01336.1 SDR family oxidoreductase [Noviherbaspirillum sedimenti]